ncbi:n-terminal binuclear zn cluster-containing dna binding domain-containing [Trichoderma cornu-damae]|uniref:N-terminal binuclear zn cluster-containing dna binding domain-containing n=1 Tax=Trichoderma cornu-damae TaxID=654480 RepID=A0A9P8QW50_9HYPO|nr:n-terminal binuclear zn cluster-containing dna binding domain-containing [Trichoderma cornu-damae]
MDDLSDQKPARRMRLGTKSCAECRRRKIRCVFPPNSSVCHGCSLHQTLCRAQQPRPRDAGRPDPAQALALLQSRSQSQSQSQSASASRLAADNAALRRRVAELEDLVGSICDALEPVGDASSVSASASAPASAPASSTTTPDIDTRAAQVIKNLKSHGFLQETPPSCGFGTALTNPGMLLPSDPSSSLLSPGSLDQDTASSLSDYADKSVSAADAPLLHLFRDALLIRETEGELYDDPEDPSTVYLMKESISAFRPPIPDAETLRLILEDSKMFWPMWPTYYFGPDLSNAMHTTSLDTAEAYMAQILNYSRGVEFCTALLFLTLCIQQLPRHWKRVIISPSISRQVLIDAYIRFVCVLLSVEGRESVHVVQCQLLLHKILINMARPQRAWVAIRHAISAATVIGLDRLGAGASFQRKMLWAQAWQGERQLCLLLGFPSATPALGTKDDAAVVQTLTLPQRIVRSVCVILGRVIERNLNPDAASYATTVQLDQDMAELKRDFPPEWSEPHGPDDTVESIYSQEGAKIFYYSALRHIHLPYMLKAKSDRRYEHSRLSTMEACREIIKVYLSLRGSKCGHVQCEAMDFSIFSSAVTLILGVLSGAAAGEAPQPALCYYTEEWQLVARLIGELRKTNALLECTVAKQSAEVLETLTAASYGTYSVQNELTLVVPYFGRLRISQDGMQDINSEALAAIGSSGQNAPITTDPGVASSIASSIAFSSLPPKQGPGGQYSMPQAANTIEFSSNEFLNTTFGDFDIEMDLGQDWRSIVDAGAQYDWNQMFSSSSNTMESR